MSTNEASTTPKGRLQGKVCIITGGGNGFGETMAKAFVKEGARVVIADVNPIGGGRVEEEIRSAHGKEAAVFQQADVTSLASWKKLLERTLEVFGSLDVVVNNAGTTYPKKDSHTVTEDEWDKVINVNMKSIYLSTAAIMPYFMEKKAGVMLNTSSVGGIRVKNGLVPQTLPRLSCLSDVFTQVWYGGTKAFVNKVPAF
jgi:3-oxoacyl-[acyl-carrier protein] reductase